MLRIVAAVVILGVSGTCFGQVAISSSLVIVGGDRTKPISEVVAGEVVRTPQGNYRRVVRVDKTEYTGDLICIKTGYWRIGDVWATVDTLVLVCPFKTSTWNHSKVPVWVFAQDVREGDRILHLAPAHYYVSGLVEWKDFDGESIPVGAVERHPIKNASVYDIQVDSDGAYIVNSFGVKSIVHPR